MLKKYFYILISAIVFLSGCGTKKEYYSEKKDYVFSEEFINSVPDYVEARLPEDFTKEDAYNSFSEELLEENLNTFGRYDGLAMVNYGTSFYSTSENQGFVLKLYGINQAISQTVGEVYFFDGEEYKLLHYI